MPKTSLIEDPSKSGEEACASVIVGITAAPPDWVAAFEKGDTADLRSVVLAIVECKTHGDRSIEPLVINNGEVEFAEMCDDFVDLLLLGDIEDEIE